MLSYIYMGTSDIRYTKEIFGCKLYLSKFCLYLCTFLTIIIFMIMSKYVIRKD